MPVPPKQPQPLTSPESGILQDVSKFFDQYAGVINISSFAVTAVSAYVSYQQNKEIIKQLREINRKLDIVIKRLAALSSKLDQIQYQDRRDLLFASLNEIELNESVLERENAESKKLAEKLRTELSINATNFLQLKPFFAFDFIGTVYGELLRLYKIVGVNNRNLKKFYRQWFTDCLSEKDPTPKKAWLDQKKLIRDMEKTYVAGTYVEVRDYGSITEKITYKVKGNIKTGFQVATKTEREHDHPDVHDDRGHGLKLLEKIAAKATDPFSKAHELYLSRVNIADKLAKGIERIESYILV